MQCHACGEALKETDKFCSSCGAKPLVEKKAGDGVAQSWIADPRIKGDHLGTTAMDSKLVNAGVAAEKAQPQPAAGGGMGLWIAIAAVALGGIGVAIYFLASW